MAKRQRVAIGRAIVRELKAFLSDEPLSNLDAALRVNMRLEITELHQSLKTTMIYVTHDQVEGMTMAERIVVLRAGNVEQVGSPLDLYRAPNNLFIAGFIGSPQMNLIQGQNGIRPEVLGDADGIDPIARDVRGTNMLRAHTDRCRAALFGLCTDGGSGEDPSLRCRWNSMP